MNNMNMASALGILYGLSELGLTLAKRRGQRNKAADAGSLGMIWVVVGASIGAAFYVARAFPEGAFSNPGLALIAGLALFIPGAVLRWYAIFYLGRYFTVDVRVAEDQRVVDTGPYRLIRHPSYTGAFMQFLGFALCIGNAWSVLVVMVPVLVVFAYRIRVEERALEQGLGEAYANYRRRTKRLVPFVYSFFVCAFALSLLTACDTGPDVRLLIHASQPLAHDCLEKIPEHMTPQVPVAQVRRARPHKGVEYEVRGPGGSISVFQDFEVNQIEVALTSEGSGSNLGLLKNVQRGVLGACNLDPAKDPIDRSCKGDACKDPAYPTL